MAVITNKVVVEAFLVREPDIPTTDLEGCTARYLEPAHHPGLPDTTDQWVVRMSLNKAGANPPAIDNYQRTALRPGAAGGS